METTLKLGSSALTLKVGAVLTATTSTVEVMAGLSVSTPPLGLPPLSVNDSMVTLRVPALGSLLRFA